MSLCYLGLGGNVGDVVATMDAALDRLDARGGISVQTVSRVFMTAPVGVDVGGPFLNAAARVHSTLAPEALLEDLKSVERELGRTPGDRWTERVIDLDLLLIDAETIDSRRLTVPHPHLWYRRFVLDPLVEIAADVVHPQLHESVGRLHARMKQRPLHLALIGGGANDRRTAESVLRTYKPLVDVRPLSAAGDLDDASPPHPDHPLELGFVDAERPDRFCRRRIDLSSLPGSVSDAVAAVMTAALDEPRPYSRPLRRTP